MSFFIQSVFIQSAHAAVVLSAVSATANVPSAANTSLSSVIDQSGLSSQYVSGVTEASAYFASDPTHENFRDSSWSAQIIQPSVQVTFDLGGSYDLEAFALWNRGVTFQGVRDFSLSFSDTADFSNATSVSGLVGGAAGSIDAVLAELFTFSIVRASFVRMDIFSTYNVNGSLTFQEVAFVGDVSEVPAPPAFALFAAGLAVSRFRRRVFSK